MNSLVTWQSLGELITRFKGDVWKLGGLPGWLGHFRHQPGDLSEWGVFLYGTKVSS